MSIDSLNQTLLFNYPSPNINCSLTILCTDASTWNPINLNDIIVSTYYLQAIESSG